MERSLLSTIYMTPFKEVLHPSSTSLATCFFPQIFYLASCHVGGASCELAHCSLISKFGRYLRYLFLEAKKDAASSYHFWKATKGNWFSKSTGWRTLENKANPLSSRCQVSSHLLIAGGLTSLCWKRSGRFHPCVCFWLAFSHLVSGLKEQGPALQYSETPFIESEALITLADLVPLLSCQIGMAVHKRGKTTNLNILQTYICYLTWNVLKWLGDRVTIVRFWWQQPKNRCQLATMRLQAIVRRRFSPTQLGGLEFHVREILHACCF